MGREFVLVHGMSHGAWAWEPLARRLEKNGHRVVAMDLPGAGTVFMSQSLRYLAPTYLGDTLTAEVEVLALKPDKPVCQLRATITNQDGTVVLEGECWTYTLRPE